jgi:aryl-alcohol dehydrogenase-like predicted oxidoreductase
VQQLYILRRFSSWSFRLSVGVALLVSSAGLAASLLVGAALGEAEAQNLSWQPSGHATQAASELAARQPAAERALLLSLSRLAPAYVFASSSTASTLPGSTSPGPLPEPSASATPPPPAASTPLSAVQQSWRTFKQAFR